MRFSLIIPAIALQVALATAGCQTPAPVAPTLPQGVLPLPASMKGYEIFCWQNEYGWNFGLLPATNRTKTVDEFTEIPPGNDVSNYPAVLVQGEDQLKLLVQRLPKGTALAIGWAKSGPALPDELLNEIKKFCKDNGILLTVGSIPSLVE